MAYIGIPSFDLNTATDKRLRESLRLQGGVEGVREHGIKGMKWGVRKKANLVGLERGADSESKPTVRPNAAPKFLYHGTSSLYLPGIKSKGLTGKRVYVTTNPDLAFAEAKFSVDGDLSGAPGVGGKPVVVVIDADHPSVAHGRWRSDPEYSRDVAYGNVAFKSGIPVSPKAVSRVVGSSVGVDNERSRFFEPRFPKQEEKKQSRQEQQRQARADLLLSDWAIRAKRKYGG
jgi:hypothetical protein